MKTLIITRLAFLSFLFSCLALLAAENARVVNLVATPRTPWNGLVDITYSLECDTPDDAMAVSFHLPTKAMPISLRVPLALASPLSKER